MYEKFGTLMVLLVLSRDVLNKKSDGLGGVCVPERKGEADEYCPHLTRRTINSNRFTVFTALLQW